MDFKTYVLIHDTSKAFIIIYLLISVVLCLFLSLFWFIVVILIHIGLDILKRHYQGIKQKKMIVNSLKDNRIDFLFIAIEIALVLLFSFGIGIAGLRLLREGRTTSLAKSAREAKSIRGTEAVREAELIRGTKITREVEYIKGSKAAKNGKFGKAAEEVGCDVGQESVQKMTKSSKKSVDWWNSLSRGDKISVLIFIICLYFIIINPVLIGCTAGDIFCTIGGELRPIFEFQLPW